VGTGNYNPTTARLYEDVGLFTCDPEIGADLTHLFNFLTGYSREARYRKLLVAPRWLRPRLQDLILQEAAAGPRGRIIAKLNYLADPALVELFYSAGEAGVEIDLIIRGICCLRPGVPGLSDNIRVRSIVGRNLEHSRVFYFANGAGPGLPAYYTGSADLMPRNLDKRVEVLVPIDSPDLQARLREILEVSLTDDACAWELDPDARWRRVEGGQHDAQRRMRELAAGRARRGDRA
jgi:polyphosphate kinase